MKDIFKKFFSKKEKKAKTVETKSLPKPMFNFVQQYTLVNPKQMLVDNSLWSLCEQVPVAYEKEGASSGFVECVELPTEVVSGFLYELQRAPGNIVDNPVMRTVSVIALKNGKKMYILPNLQSPKTPDIFLEKPKELAFHVNPEINRAIANQLKLYTR